MEREAINYRIDFFKKIDIGRVRKTNQDCAKYGVLPDGISCYGIVCDGIGSSEKGGVAAEITVNGMAKFVEKEFTKEFFKNSNSIEEAINSGIAEINDLIHRRSIEENQSVPMGTTIVMGIINNGVLHVINVGDSRCYVIKKGEIKRISTDHSVVQELFEIGEITEEEAKNSPQKNVITRAIGTESSVKIDYFSQNLSGYEGVLLCSDGLTNHVSDAKIQEIFFNCKAEEFCDMLVNCANEDGGTDNISVVFMHKVIL